MKEMKVVVCSKNKAKNAAVDNVLKQFFLDYEIVPIKTKSKVSETPISDEEGITGCMNRISDAMNQINGADLYIAMEGILSKTFDETYLCGWTIIYDRASDSYLSACSSKVRVPREILANLSKDERLSDVVAKYIGSTDEEVSIYGTNGVLTHGCYTREIEFVDSVLCAISIKYKRIG